MEQSTLEVIQEIMKHLTILNDEYGQISIDVAVLKAQMSSVIWWGKAFGTAVIGMLVFQIWQLFTIKKNGKK